jgi:hypothetical protein
MEFTVTAEPVNIFLIGISEGLARSLARYVHSDSGVALTGVAPSLALAEIMLPDTPTAVALVDWSALGGSPRDSLRALRLGCPGLRIICVASEADAYSVAAAEAGADAVISLDRFAGELDFLLRMFFPGRHLAYGDRHG